MPKSEVVSRNLQRDLPQIDLKAFKTCLSSRRKSFNTEITGLLQSFYWFSLFVSRGFFATASLKFASRIWIIHGFTEKQRKIWEPNMEISFELNSFEGVLATTGSLIRRGTVTIDYRSRWGRNQIRRFGSRHLRTFPIFLTRTHLEVQWVCLFTIKLADNILKENSR